jgi:hypothetical protein
LIEIRRALLVLMIFGGCILDNIGWSFGVQDGFWVGHDCLEYAIEYSDSVLYYGQFVKPEKFCPESSEENLVCGDWVKSPQFVVFWSGGWDLDWAFREWCRKAVWSVYNRGTEAEKQVVLKILRMQIDEFFNQSTVGEAGRFQAKIYSVIASKNNLKKEYPAWISQKNRQKTLLTNWVEERLGFKM